MKYLFMLLFCSSFLFGQEKYLNVKPKLDKAVKDYAEKGKTNPFLNTIISNFNQSSKGDLESFKKTNVGICIVLSSGNPELVTAPSKYTFSNEKINISAIGPQDQTKLSADIKDYVQKYTSELENVGKTILFKKIIQKDFEAEGTFSENSTEYIVNEPYTISFVRGDQNWMYIISIEDDYKNLDDARIIVYAFKKTISGPDIFKQNNAVENMEERRKERQSKNEENRAKYPLYHDYRIDDLRVGLNQLLKFEPFKSDKTLNDYTSNLTEKLDRFTIRNYVKELNYFVNLDISEDFIKKNFDSYPHGEYAVENLTHLSAHALGDIYFSQGNYNAAKEFYIKSVFNYPLIASSGTTVGKDVDRTIYDLAKNASKANKKDEYYAFIIALMFSSDINTENDINLKFKEENEDKKQFKKDLDKALKTLKKDKQYSYTFTFRGNNVFFIPMLQESVKSFQENFKSQIFYKSLD